MAITYPQPHAIVAPPIRRAGGPANATHLFATYQIRVGTGLLSEGAAISLVAGVTGSIKG